MKENLKPCAYKQTEGERSPDVVLIEERSGELLMHARLRRERALEPKGNRV